MASKLTEKVEAIQTYFHLYYPVLFSVSYVNHCKKETTSIFATYVCINIQTVKKIKPSNLQIQRGGKEIIHVNRVFLSDPRSGSSTIQDGDSKTFYTKWFVNQTSRAADDEPHNSWPGAVWRMQCWLFLPHFLCSWTLLSMGFCFEFAILSRLGSSILASIWFHLKGAQNMEIPLLKICFFMSFLYFFLWTFFSKKIEELQKIVVTKGIHRRASINHVVMEGGVA